MAKNSFAIFRSRPQIIVLLCLFGLFTVFKNTFAGVLTPIANHEPVAISTNTPYPSPASPDNALQSEQSFLPLISKNYPPYHVESLSYYMWTTDDVYGLGCSIGSSAAQNPEAEIVFCLPFLRESIPK